jgi:hypothetical protein
VDGAGPQSGPQGDASGEPGERAAEDALEGFTVASGLEVTLFAGEPMLVNPTNIDIDAHRARAAIRHAMHAHEVRVLQRTHVAHLARHL